MSTRAQKVPVAGYQLWDKEPSLDLANHTQHTSTAEWRSPAAQGGKSADRTTTAFPCS